MTLLELLDEHRGAFEYDWRSRFHVPLSCMPDDMSWGEGYRLAALLLGDPSSQSAAAARGWRYPMSRAEMVSVELFDLEHIVNARRKPKPYPRPWDVEPKKIGTGTSMTVGEFRALKDATTTA